MVVEVKASQLQVSNGNEWALPGMRVDRRKQRKLVGLACQVARAYRLQDRPIRFDVVGVDLRKDGSVKQIRHHPAAFESHVEWPD